MIKSLESLVDRSKNKDPEAFGVIYDHYYKKLFNYSLRRVESRHISEDIVSNTFFKILNKINTFNWNSEAEFNSWIYRICINEINEYFRQMGKYKFVPEEEVAQFFVENEKNEIDESIDFDNKFKQVLESIKKLKDQYQEIIHLRIFEELKFSEISKILSMNESTVKVYYTRAVAELRQHLRF